ncbi:uncharacterized protein F5147DRAFT_125588 [Suillus discolor]|uniref:Uncharacterized protein n=1 Tax=Suillus discolor TaxID=1912936 RepID=A0A9P7K1A5_9AGAM|nr:uncharacterized protein F5147DRAFT_125588 [Suillus discolor]KAG2119932.1 hypothetical protein F5147DRAFT_125588 [Suillus discolor]
MYQEPIQTGQVPVQGPPQHPYPPMMYQQAQTGQMPVPGPPQPGFRPYPPMMYQQQNQMGQMPGPGPGPPQPGFHPYPPMMPQPPLVPSRFRPYPPEVYVYCYQQYLHATGQVPGPPNPVPPPPPPPHHLGGYPPAFQGMGVPPAAAPPQYPSAPPLAQPSHDTHLEQGLEEQAPVADAEESAVKRGKRKAADLDDDDAPPRKKQTISPLVDYPDFELVQNNGEVRYKCCLSQCENVPAVPRAGIQDHIKSKKHPQVRSRSPSLEYYEAVNDGDFSNIGDSCSNNQQETYGISQGTCEETTDLTSSESLETSDNSLDETTDSGWDEGFNDFFDIEAACEPVFGEQIEESINNPEETIDSASSSLDDNLYGTVDSASDEQLEESTDSAEKSVHEMDNMSSEELLEYCINHLDETYNFT